MSIRPGRLWDRGLSILVPKAAARLDRGKGPAYVSPWGGPFNGQLRRQELARALLQTTSFDVVLETGAFRGETTEFLAKISGLPVRTVERSRRFYVFARDRLAGFPAVEVTQGDSRTFLARIADSREFGMPFVYLDAHWHKDLPLCSELEIISKGWTNAVVMIDDFRVPGDEAYGYDDYGEREVLDESILPEVVSPWARFYPAAPSASETGARRGCIVLATPVRTGDLDGVELLWRAPARD